MKTALPSAARRFAWTGWTRWCFYACFGLSGFTALVFEVLWSRQFVTVFGNTSYAISSVLCAYMLGLGSGGWMGGRLADRIRRRALAYGIVQLGVAAWALLLPLLLAGLRRLAPVLPALSPDSLWVSTLTRFGLSLLVLLVPCFLMGTTLPLLARIVTNSNESIGARVGALYGWNTLGAAGGCLATGFWLIETVGVHLTNVFAVCANLLVALAVFALSKRMEWSTTTALADTPGRTALPESDAALAGAETPASGTLLLGVAFLNGLASLALEVLWLRYLAFLSPTAYVFPTILFVYLLGSGLGGLLYAALAGRIGLSLRALGVVEWLLAVSVLATFVVGAMIFAGGPPPPLDLKGMSLVTVLLPTTLMGMAFPLLCGLYGRQVATLGRRTGLLYAVNTAGTALGSLLPLFVLVPTAGIQTSVLLSSVVYGGLGLALLARRLDRDRWRVLGAAGIYAGVLLLFVFAVPSNLCQRVFLATDFSLARHTDIQFYREGRTGTAILAADRVSHRRTVYINGISEVPVSYPHDICFKMLGDLGPLLHASPDEVLMICFGGGIAAGATARLPEVKALTIVDLESSVVEAARRLARENNDLLLNPKVHVVIDDGRDYLLTARRWWPVIISDSTHPKSGDSWVLYTREFYQLARDRLTGDGVFVEWVPMHTLTTAEFKIILRTFQSVFPHTSLWVTHSADVDGQFVAYSLLVATPRPLNIDVAKLRDRLSVPYVRQDLEPFGLHTPAGFLDSFVCREEALQRWTGDGPVNTDDLPYTQYDTPYSKGENFNLAELIEPMEELWPYLTGTGSEASAAQLHDELLLRAKAARLAFLGRLEESYALLPADVRYREMRRLYEGGPQYLEALLEVYWNDPQALNWLASLREAGPGDSGRALKRIYQRVFALDPDNVTALSMLGAVDLVAGDTKSAETYLRRAVRLDPGFATPRYNLGTLLYSTGRGAEALQEWQAAALAPGGSVAAADQWGICLAQAGRVEEAIRWFRRALEITPTAGSPRLHLAAMLWQTGRREEAVAHIRFVLKMDPEDPAALKMLAGMEGAAGTLPPP